MTTIFKTQKHTTFARLMSILLLAFMGIAACYGGGALILDPSGKLLEMPLTLLTESNFPNYLVPGLILFLMIGLLSLLTIYFTITGNKYYPDLVFNQGFIQVGWIVVQIYLLQVFHFLQLVVVINGILLIILGAYVKKWK